MTLGQLRQPRDLLGRTVGDDTLELAAGDTEQANVRPAARPSRITHPLLKLHFGLVAAAGHATRRSVMNYVLSKYRYIR